MARVTPKPILVGERIQQLDMLLHIQEFSSMVAVITGAAETGKTALLESAVSQLSIHHQVVSFSATNYQTEHQILGFISEQLNSESSWSSIEEALSRIHSLNESVSLLIDDAHFLTFELLEMLSVRAVSEDGWHLAVAGDEQISDSLARVQRDLHHSNLIHHIELVAITESEAVDLAEAYFRNEGLGSVPISVQKIDNLWKLSEGIPGKLIRLFENEKDQKITETSKFPIGHVAAICLIAIALSFSYFYQEDPIEGMDAIDQILAASEAPGVSIEALVNKRVNGSAGAVVELDKGRAAEKRPQQVGGLIKAPIEVKPEVKPIAKVSVKDSSKQIKISKVETTKSPKLTASKPIPIQHPLLKAAPDGFALQLLGVRSRASAEKVMIEFKRALETDQLSVYETKYEGQPWFVVVYGPINNKKKARQKAGSIAKTLNNQPWIRPMAKIQEDIRRIQP